MFIGIIITLDTGHFQVTRVVSSAPECITASPVFNGIQVIFHFCLLKRELLLECFHGINVFVNFLEIRKDNHWWHLPTQTLDCSQVNDTAMLFFLWNGSYRFLPLETVAAWFIESNDGCSKRHVLKMCRPEHDIIFTSNYSWSMVNDLWVVSYQATLDMNYWPSRGTMFPYRNLDTEVVSTSWKTLRTTKTKKHKKKEHSAFRPVFILSNTEYQLPEEHNDSLHQVRPW